MTWLEKIVPSIGLLIGIVFVAIGATMGFSALLKIAIYNPTHHPVYTNCEYDFERPVPVGKETERRSEKEIEACVARVQKEESARYFQGKKDNIIDGGVFLVVGIAFWAIFARKRKNTILS